MYVACLDLDDPYRGAVEDLNALGGLWGAVWTNGDNAELCLCSSGFSQLSLAVLVTACDHCVLISFLWNVGIDTFLYLHYEAFQKFIAGDAI